MKRFELRVYGGEHDGRTFVVYSKGRESAAIAMVLDMLEGSPHSLIRVVAKAKVRGWGEGVEP